MSSPPLDRTRLLTLLKETFGHAAFRPGQEAVIQRVIAGGDSLVVMPTGAGKSLCYQLPALYRDGLTIVVSPLIALMKDQVDGLIARGVATTFINSSLEPEERDERMARVRRGEVKLLYVAPERFRGGTFARQLAALDIGLLVIDEAHCASQWGHDFRPDYLALGRVREALGRPTTLALTATATPEVQEDVLAILGLGEAETFVTGFDRPNFELVVQECRNLAEKTKALHEELDRLERPAIIYCATRKSVEKVREELTRRREPLVSYHAGMTSPERTEAQDIFMAGKARIAVATNAFGMGIDKEDIRGVVHFEIPRTIEAYYQEIGRAGRDGKPARVSLLYRRGDQSIQAFFIDNSHPPEALITQVYEALVGTGTNPVFRSHRVLAEAIGENVTERMVGAALQTLEKEGWVRRLPLREGMSEIHFPPRMRDIGKDGLPTRGLALRVWQHLVEMRRTGGHALAATGAAPAATSTPLEEIPVHLPTLADQLGVDRTKLSAALSSLEGRGVIQVTHGDRCAGAQLLRPGEELNIDFAPLKARRDREYGKLERMVAYAEANECRRRQVLEYFGESPPWNGCGRCDACATDPGRREEPRPLVGEAETMARKALSCLARMGEHSESMVQKVLTGSKDAGVKSMGFDRLSTYGLLSDLTQDETRQVLRALVKAGCVEEKDVTRSVQGFEKRYRVLTLSPLGERVMRRQEPDFLMVFPRVGPLKARRGKAVAAGPSPAAPDMDLFEHLRRVRRDIAAVEGVPPYVLGPDSLLWEMAAFKPRTREEMLRLRGMGERLYERVGEKFLRAMAGLSRL